VHILSALAFLGWLAWSGDLRVALNIAAAVLIITCPCALGLAVPAVTTAASGRLFAKGLLIKNATALERLAEVDTVVLDKTGTLTLGVPQVMNWADLPAPDQALAAALAAGSAHPLSRAITAAAAQTGVVAEALEDVKEAPGFGTEARMAGARVRLGRPDWIGVKADDAGLCAALERPDGRSLLIRFEDAMRPGAQDLVAALSRSGVDLCLISGDRPEAVRGMAEKLGIPNWRAQMLPQDKIAYVEKLRDEGHKVLMVGDGLNDTGALAASHVSISPAQALDAARAASDIVLLGKDLSPVADALATARLATKRIRQNFRIATFYNIVAVPLAVAGFATPLIAALAMSTSSIMVSLNALRLKGRA
jgi:Cu2+-exporting ATPase